MLALALQPLALQPHARVCFIRHGQSEWNAAKRFTGWTDIDLTDHGREEAEAGGLAVRARGLSFDRAFTSELRRAQETLTIALHAMEQPDVPTMRHWRLNERHYGALQGRSKQACVDEFGIDAVRVWRNAYDVPPPLVSTHAASFPGNDPTYSSVEQSLLPRGECLQDTLNRAVPFWNAHVVPELAAGHSVLIAAHGHSIRALVKHLDRLSDTDVAAVSIPNGIPLLYELDAQLRPLRSLEDGGDDDDAPAEAHARARCKGHALLGGTYLGDNLVAEAAGGDDAWAAQPLAEVQRRPRA